MNKIILYGTLGCHLCDEAYDLVKPLLSATAFTIEKVDIAENTELLSLYDVRIPVLYRPSLQLELDWPFDHAIIEAFLSANA
ncbi:MAG: hypothetical protein ACJA0N_000586 [Pseudohongiellaceae bacterium]|jgi:hypothetical protein